MADREAKYGSIPSDVYPLSWSSRQTEDLNQIVNAKLREYAVQLRYSPDRSKKESFLSEIYTTLCVAMGTPP